MRRSHAHVNTQDFTLMFYRKINLFTFRCEYFTDRQLEKKIAVPEVPLNCMNFGWKKKSVLSNKLQKLQLQKYLPPALGLML